MPRRPMIVPAKEELWTAIDRTETELMEMIGEALDGIPVFVRDRLALIVTPLHSLLRRARRRP